MSSTPHVSIILPTYNRCDLLPRALASLYAQTMPDFEVLLIDDGSTDGTADYIKAHPEPRLRYVPLPSNVGQSAARNEGIRLARAPWIAFQDSDDEWLPEKLAWQLAVTARDPDVGMVYGDLLRVFRVGEPLRICAPELTRGQVLDERPSLYSTFMLGVQSCLFRAEVLRALGGFKEELRCFEDLELFLRFIRRYRAIKVPEVVSHYHETDGVSQYLVREHAARRYLLRRYGWLIALKNPKGLRRELKNLKAGRPLGWLPAEIGDA